MRAKRMLSLVAALAAVVLLAAACGGDSNKLKTDNNGSGGGAGKHVVIGSAGFTEINLMAAMYQLLLEKAGYSTSIKVVANRELYEPALEKGQINVVPDYAATMAEFLNVKKNGPNAKPVSSNDKDQTVAALNKLAEPLGLKALDPAQAVDQNAFAATTANAKKNGANLSDWNGQKVVLAATPECPDRPFCQPGLKNTYGITVTKLLPLGFGTAQVKKALTDNKAQLGLVGTTDATLASMGLVIIKDDKGLQEADNLVPVVGKGFTSDTTMADTLNKLAGVLTTDDLAQMDKKVDGERQKPADVAKAYLQSKGLL
ncbi:MAG: osmoprotectant transport system substrate-binding protein [Actinomycetota bacterium]|jgi:osmoprotectant transport system substrate-binding protein|nr:osmoprotectant transport system substrate-binding protein [Actinomycetota bacterium]